MDLVLDLTDLHYLPSRGLRSLTEAGRRAGARIAIILANPNQRVREIPAISRYDRMFKVCDSVAAALGG
nr:STAS domain-containing protein [Phenylobacterium sp.]